MNKSPDIVIDIEISKVLETLFDVVQEQVPRIRSNCSCIKGGDEGKKSAQIELIYKGSPEYGIAPYKGAVYFSLIETGKRGYRWELSQVKRGDNVEFGLKYGNRQIVVLCDPIKS